MEFRPVKQSLYVVIQWWRKIQISVVRNPKSSYSSDRISSGDEVQLSKEGTAL